MLLCLGHIPEQLGALTKLENLELDNNELCGEGGVKRAILFGFLGHVSRAFSEINSSRFVLNFV